MKRVPEPERRVGPDKVNRACERLFVITTVPGTIVVTASSTSSSNQPARGNESNENS